MDYLALYNTVADQGERVGPYVFGLSFALTALIVAATSAMVFLSGRRDRSEEGQVVDGRDPVKQPDYFTGVGKMAFRSRRKVLFSASAGVTPEEIASGRATRSQWLLVIGITAAFFRMSLTMIGVGLMLMKSDPTWIVAIPFGFVLFGYYYMQLVLRDYWKAKRKLAAKAQHSRGSTHRPSAGDRAAQ